MSVMEMSHRGKQFTQIRNEAEADLRELLAVPNDFEVLFMQGGATAENAIVPLNLIGRGGAGKADYGLTGIWSNKSHKEAQRYGDIAVAASSGADTVIDGVEQTPWTWYPPAPSWTIRPDASYLHVCSNETIGGLDRKSTRLNSSHVKTSYAVFCLKKKKIYRIGRRRLRCT